MPVQAFLLLTHDGLRPAFELGAGPTWAPVRDGPTLAIPVKVGLSLKNYYESGAVDNKFGFFDVGALLTFPITIVPGHFGSWIVHGGGADVLVFGATTKLLNVNAAGEVKKRQVVGLVGIGLRYWGIARYVHDARPSIV